MAAAKLADQLKNVAVDALEADPRDLEFADGSIRVAGTDRAITLVDLAAHPKASADALRAADAFVPKAPTYPNGTHVAEVEIDEATGHIQIVNYVIVDDFGVSLNPLMLEGQVHGGTVQGIGQALMENTVYDADSGQLVTASLMDYALPRAGDMPFHRLRDPQRALQGQSARREGRGRSRRYRLLSGGHQCGDRRAVARPRYFAYRHAGDTGTRLVCDRFRAALEHDAEKCEAVFGRHHALTYWNRSRRFWIGSIQNHRDLGTRLRITCS